VKDTRPDDELNRIIDDWAHPAPRYHLRKHGLFWRPKSAGYTSEITMAGIYTKEEAQQRAHPHGQPDDVTMHLVPPGNFCGDLNLIHAAEAVIYDAPCTVENDRKRKLHRRSLEAVCGRYATFYRSTARQRAEALVRVIEESKQEPPPHLEPEMIGRNGNPPGDI